MTPRRLNDDNGAQEDGDAQVHSSCTRHPRRVALWLVAISLGLVWTASQYKYYFWPKRFRVVESEQIYRGGWQTPRILRQILQQYHIQAVLNVACNPPEREAAGEGAVVREYGVRWFKILMPGTGLATLDQLDQAADVLADPNNRPIFVHCAAGVHRTNMSLAAYRLKYCGWPLDQTLDEMARYGYDRQHDVDKAELLQRYSERLANSARFRGTIK